MMLGRLFGRSKQNADKNDPQVPRPHVQELLVQELQVQEPQVQEPQVQEPQVQEEADAAEPSTDLPSIHEPLAVSPSPAKEVTFDLLDQSAEDAASIVNDLALNDVSRSSPEASAPGKRKRQDTDVVDRSPAKRVAKKTRATVNGNEPPTTLTNGNTEPERRPNRASSEVVQAAPRKLSRPKKGQPKGHMAQVYPAVQKSGDIWSHPPSPKEQVEGTAPPPAAPTSPEVPPRRRGRPRRTGPSPTQKPTPMKKGKRSEELGSNVNPGRKGRPEGYVSPEVEIRASYQPPVESTPQKPGQKGRPKGPKNKAREDQEAPAKPKSKEITLRPRNGEDIAQATTKKASNRVRKDEVDDFEVGQRLQNRAVSNKLEDDEEEEEEEAQAQAGRKENENEPEREGIRDSEVVGAGDPRTSSQLDKGERKNVETGEESSEFDDSIQATESEEEDKGDEKVELFGQDRAWRTILEGARSVCGKNLPLNQMPKLLTPTMRDLVNDVKDARDVYDQLLSLRGTDTDPLVVLDDELRKSLDAIETQIRKLSEKNAATKGAEMIRDIYARAIPAMVFLLQSALASRVYHSIQPYTLETLNENVSRLKEIIRLQKMAILLCEKAKIWKAKPIQTSQPIVRTTARQIFPCLRDMSSAFSKALVEQKQKRKTKQNAVDSDKQQRELAESSQQAKLETARKKEILHRKLEESREQWDERRRNEKRTVRQIIEDEARARMRSPQVNGHVESRTMWSDAEDLALYFQLEKGYEGGLTSAERYLNILNTPLLQNKLPEHIRERALYFKPYLLEERGALEWISNIE